jgi:alkylation response protein AidB-like acyl-CoA dehydrogenase
MIVDLLPTEEQDLIVRSIDELLRRELPIERLRDPAKCAGAVEREIWGKFVSLGLFGLGLSESAGGLGYGLAEEVLAARSLGRHGVSPAVLATMLAAHVAVCADQPNLAASFVAGDARAAFANRLDGTDAVHLIDASECDWLLVPEQPLKLVPRTSVQSPTPVQSVDETLSLERACLSHADALIAERADHASLLCAAYLVGNAQATLAMATSYAGVRKQFGQPIGSFQAIKHSCADMAVRASSAEAQTFYAALASDIRGTGRDVACARWLAREAALANAKANIQIHGGMGFTAECDAHLFLKRGLVIGMLGSDQRREFAAILPVPEA